MIFPRKQPCGLEYLQDQAIGPKRYTVRICTSVRPKNDWEIVPKIYSKIFHDLTNQKIPQYPLGNFGDSIPIGHHPPPGQQCADPALLRPAEAAVSHGESFQVLSGLSPGSGADL